MSDELQINHVNVDNNNRARCTNVSRVPVSCRTVALRKNVCCQTGLSTKGFFPESYSSAASIWCMSQIFHFYTELRVPGADPENFSRGGSNLDV